MVTIFKTPVDPNAQKLEDDKAAMSDRLDALLQRFKEDRTLELSSFILDLVNHPQDDILLFARKQERLFVLGLVTLGSSKEAFDLIVYRTLMGDEVGFGQLKTPAEPCLTMRTRILVDLIVIPGGEDAGFQTLEKIVEVMDKAIPAASTTTTV